MRNAVGLPVTLSLVLIFSTPARAEHAKIELVVAGGGNQVTAHVDQTPPEWGKNPRKVLKVKANEPVRIRFLLTNIYPHKTLENVVVHLFVVRQEKVGQKEVPDLRAISCSRARSTWISSRAERPVIGRASRSPSRATT